MNKKRQLTTILALSILTIYMMNIQGVSAPPQSPYIAVVPSSNIMYVGYNRTISIYTDYGGGDVWGWDVKLTFNKTLLQCVKVTNGDLITAAKDTSAEFHSNINNTIGEVKAGALFYYDEITFPPFVTSGPGTLVKITFKGLNKGNSSLHIEGETKLQVFNATKALQRGKNPDLPFSEIEAGLQPKQIGHGTAIITIPGDCNGSKKVDGTDFGIFAPAYGSSAGQPAYKLVADINNSSKVDGTDFGIFAPNYGKSW